MRAAVTDAGHSLVVAQRDRPVPGPRQMLIRVEASGICGSDLHLLELGHADIVLGHEFTGTVVRLGDGVTAFAAGDRVVSVPVHTCQECAVCRTGRPIECPHARYMGGYREGRKAQGSFAEYTVVDEGSSIMVPAAVTRDQAAFVEPLAVALRAIEKAHFELDDTLVVFGAGPIGLSVMLWAVTHGVARIVVSDPVASRRELALRLGATHAVDPTATDLAAFADRELGGAPNVAIDCVGRPGMLDQAMRLVRREGRIVVLGMHMGTDEFELLGPLLKNVTVSFSAQYSKVHFAHTVRSLAAGRLDPTPIITHRVSLDELPEAVEALRLPNEIGKVLILP